MLSMVYSKWYFDWGQLTKRDGTPYKTDKGASEVIPAPLAQKISITLHGLLHMDLDCLMNIQKDMVKRTHVKNHC